MKEKIKQITQKINDWKIFLLIIFIIGGVFYWYEWRLSQLAKEETETRKRCANWAYLPVPSGLPSFSQSQKEAIYTECLRKNGLKN